MRPNILVLNRWPRIAGYTRFEDYIDHDAYRVHYVVTRAARDGIALTEGVRSVGLLDHASVRPICDEIVAAHGPIHRVIAMAEKDLLLAGRLRDELGVVGMGEAEASRFTDKSLMKALVEKAGIPTPRYRELSCGAGDLEYPLILKPKAEAGSRGVWRIACARELADIATGLRPEEHLLEEFCSGPVFHLDGFVHQGSIVFQSSSQYVGTCLDHAHGAPLGSVELMEPTLRAVFGEFAARVVSAMALRSGSFHLECFLKGGQPIFLEIGARAGGGDIRELLDLVHGFNIVRAWIDVQLGREPHVPVGPGPRAASGFLIFPGPERRSQLVIARSFISSEPSILKEYIFPPGHNMPGGTDIFSNSAARFLFKGDEAEIRAAIDRILRGFRASYASLDAEREAS